MLLWRWIETFLLLHVLEMKETGKQTYQDKEIFIPSIEEQSILMDELVFLFATSVIQNVPQMKAEFLSIYPVHLHHRYTAQAGEKTKQV